MKISKLLKRLQLTQDPELQRELLLEAWESCDSFFVGLQMSCDPNVTVPVTKIPDIDAPDDGSGDFTFNDFLTLWDEITQVDVDPEVARLKIIDAAMCANVTEWNLFYRRILRRKLQEDVPMEIIVELLSSLTGFKFQL